VSSGRRAIDQNASRALSGFAAVAAQVFGSERARLKGAHCEAFDPDLALGNEGLELRNG
jgi:hypothetical protein